MEGSVLGVDFRHHQRHGGIQAEGAGIVHKDRTSGPDGWSKAESDVIFSGPQHQINALERGLVGLLNGNAFAAEGLGLSHAPGAGQELQFSHREIPLLQKLPHLLTHGSSGAQNGDGIFSHGDQILSLLGAEWVSVAVLQKVAACFQEPVDGLVGFFI